MIKSVLVGVLLFAINLKAMEFKLKENYIFYKDVVTSFDIFPSIERDFFIHKVTDKDKKFYLSSVHLIKVFKDNGYKVTNGNRIRNVKFIRVSPKVCLQCIASKLEEAYITKYPFLNIENLDIYPKEYIEKLPQNYRINFNNSNLKKSAGYFYIVDNHRDRTYFKYSVDAYLPVVKTMQSVRKGDLISYDNSYPTDIKFERMYREFISEKSIGSVKAKRFLLKNTALTDRDVEKLSVINRGDRVKASLRDGVITIQVEATALQKGAVGDTIYIKTFEGSRLRADVVSKNFVEIID